jgi:hypothetical protein
MKVQSRFVRGRQIFALFYLGVVNDERWHPEICSIYMQYNNLHNEITLWNGFGFYHMTKDNIRFICN